MIQNQWYPACASVQLKSEPFATQVGDTKIVLFRDQNQKACALLDRCCHRGFPLSKGKMENGKIACGYHGWQFEGSGQCAVIPSQTPDKPIPKSHCVKSFPISEKDGFVWVWIGEKTPTTAPSFPEAAEGNWILGSREMQCHYLRALEVTFDAPHLYFVHPTHPATLAAKKYGFAESAVEVRGTEDGCVMFAPVTQSENDPIPAGVYLKMKFELPGTIRFEFPIGPIAKAYMFFFTVPVGKNACRMSWLLTNFDPNPSERVKWVAEGKEIVEEDQYVLEAIQKSYDLEDESFERNVEADIPTLTVRKVVRAAEAGEWDGKNFPFPSRRLVKMVGAGGRLE
jgi:phenylpropionate dioxygenase-like ring-hydroxylating dioxygenase large terminal subunit